jgi:hypothetical protein
MHYTIASPLSLSLSLSLSLFLSFFLNIWQHSIILCINYIAKIGLKSGDDPLVSNSIETSFGSSHHSLIRYDQDDVTVGGTE